MSPLHGDVCPLFCHRLVRQLELRCGAKGVGTDILFEVAEVTKPLPGPAQLWEMWEGPLQDLVARGTRDSAKGSVFGLSIYLASPRTVAVLTRWRPPCGWQYEAPRTRKSV